MTARDDTPRSGAGIRTLCDWASATRLEQIPDAVLVRAVRVLMDDMAAIIGARTEPEVERFHDWVLGRVALHEATVLRGGRPRTDRIWAAVANAVAGDWLELDEGYRVVPCHAGLYTIPALIAEAEAVNLPFGAMLRALVLGYEVVTRVARSWTPRDFSMQAHGRYCSIGAAAAVALARNVDAQHLHRAITGAATLVTASPRNHLVSGALIRNAWPAVGAWNGIMSVEWAGCGLGGVDGSFDDVYTTVFGGQGHPERITKDLGTNWALLDGYTKQYACCQHLHSAVEATLAVRAELEGRGGASGIAGIEVETHPLAVPLDNARPVTTLGAKFSMPHAVAAAVVTGTGGADAFLANTLAEPTIVALREHVRVGAYAPIPPAPNDRPARVRFRMRDGGEVVGECLSAAGGPDRPFPPSLVVDKATALTGGVYPKLVPTLLTLTDAGRARSAPGWAELLRDICA